MDDRSRAEARLQPPPSGIEGDDRAAHGDGDAPWGSPLKAFLNAVGGCTL